MIVKKMIYTETVDLLTMQKWRKIGIVELEVEEGENPYDALDKAKEIVEESHKKYLPELPMQQSKGDLYFNVSTQKEER